MSETGAAEPAAWTPAQGELFAPSEMRKGWEPPKIDPDDIRRRLNKMLDLARAADPAAPEPIESLRRHRVIFPQMANWLPQEEADALRALHRAEMERLNLIPAAA